VPLCFRSSWQRVLQCITNFGSRALAPFRELVSLVWQEVNSLRRCIDDITGMQASIGKARSRVGAKSARPQRRRPRAVAEKQIVHRLSGFFVLAGLIRRLRPESAVSVMMSRPVAGALRVRIKRSVRLAFKHGGSYVPSARYSPGTQKSPARKRTGANGWCEYMELSNWNNMSYHQYWRALANGSE
jgi:hypothetical protein